MEPDSKLEINSIIFSRHGDYRDGIIASLPTSPIIQPPSILQKIIEEQRFHWCKGHRYAVDHLHDWNADSAEYEYQQWNKDIPKSCGCSDHWSSLVAANPPIFETPESYAKWLWSRHNDVNERLRAKDGGHPEVSWQACCELYGYPEGWRD